MAEASSKQPARERPLSPHLQIYRPEINMVMSVFHRMTGSALYFGSLLLAWWLFAAATGPDYFAFVNGLFATWPGMIVLVGFQLGADPSHAGRPAPFHLGHRLQSRHH